MSQSQAQIDAETAEAWRLYRKQQRTETEEEYHNQVCPCGHKRDQHYSGEGECEKPYCGCPQFGEPVESWETFTEVNLGDSPGGLKAYE